jgi:hypothetical protein
MHGHPHANLVELPPPPARRPARLGRALGVRLARFGTRLARVALHFQRRRASEPEPGPAFTVSGVRATFEEIERITLDPVIVKRIEGPPRGELVHPERPEPELSREADAFGWKRRERPARVYDVVPFGFELDMLELRLAELDDVVDRFVVAEASRGYGGMRKPLYLQRNWSRFAPFHGKLEHVIVDADGLDALYPQARRERTDWRGENFLRARIWERMRRLALEPGAVVIWGDVDELLPHWLIRLLKYYECPLPMRFRAPAFRYHFGWRDPEAYGYVTVVDATSFERLDREPAAGRSLPARAFAARGAVHLTSFLDPAVLVMKFALTTDWVKDILPYIRNEHGETAAMMRNGTWFGRPLAPYDPEADPLGLVPATARLNRARDPVFWPW